MRYYYVNVSDRVTGQTVTVGCMLTVAEVRELISSLEKFNSTDFLIYKGIENFERS